MAVSRHTEDELRQFASQLNAVSVSDLRLIESSLPDEETRDFLLGFLTALGVVYQNRNINHDHWGPMIAVLAERILKIEDPLYSKKL